LWESSSVALSQPEFKADALPIDIAERRQRVAQHRCVRFIISHGIDV